MPPRLSTREIRRVRRDSSIVLDLIAGDRLDRGARRSRIARASDALEALGAPEPERLAAGLLTAVGATVEVPADATTEQLGFVGEVALAGRSAFADERDFGEYEVKTSLARDENRALRLFGWREERAALRALCRQRSSGDLGMPLVLTAGAGGPAGLVRTARMLFVSDDRGEIVWRRSWAAFERLVGERVGAVVLLRARTAPLDGQRRRLEIVRADVMWEPDAARLGALIDRGHAGLLVEGGVSVAVRRAMLPGLYRCVVNVERRRLPARSVLVLHRPRRAPGPDLDGYARARNRPLRARRRHAPAWCACCDGPMSWSAGCTVCGGAAAF